MTEEELKMTEDLRLTPAGQQRFAAFAEQEPTRELVIGIAFYADMLKRIEQGKGMPLYYKALFEASLEVYRQVFAARRRQENAAPGGACD